MTLFLSLINALENFDIVDQIILWGKITLPHGQVVPSCWQLNAIWIYRQTFFSIAIVQFYVLTKLPELLKITEELTFKWFPCCQYDQPSQSAMQEGTFSMEMASWLWVKCIVARNEKWKMKNIITTVSNREKGIQNEPAWTNIDSYSLMHKKWEFIDIKIIQLGLF